MVKSFLGCMELKTGVFIFGYIGMIFSFINFIVSTVLIAIMDKIFENYEDTFDKKAIETVCLVIAIVVLICSVINFFTSTMLIIGTHKELHSFLLPWLVMQVIWIVICCINIIIIIAQIGSQFPIGLVVVIIQILFIGIAVYVFMVTQSLYVQFKNNSRSNINLSDYSMQKLVE